jgi:hypothetical protein
MLKLSTKILVTNNHQKLGALFLRRFLGNGEQNEILLRKLKNL